MSSGKPTFQITHLDNGLRIVTSEMPYTRSVSAGMFVGVGSRHEPTDKAGISHLVEHLIFKGTESRPTPLEISGTIEGMGGMMNAHTEPEVTVFWCKVAQPQFAETLDLMVDVMRNSLYDKADIEKERLVVLEELNMNYDNPSSRLDAVIDEMLWPDHPLGRDIAGSKETIMNMTRNMVIDHVERSYNPSNIVLSVAGNINHDEVVTQTAALCDDWKPRAPMETPEAVFTQDTPTSRIEYRKTEQVNFSIAFPGLSNTDPNRYALDLLSLILGEGMSSRLFIELRENLGLAYDIHSRVPHYQDSGAFVVTAGVDPGRIYKAVETVLTEIVKIKDPVPDEELTKAKGLGAGRLMLQMDDTTAVSGWNGTQAILQGSIDEVDEVVKKINNTTASEVAQVANSLLQTKRLNLAIVGPYDRRNRLEQILTI